MGNTISKSRRRPRVKSVNFRALWWCVQREATLNVLYPDDRATGESTYRVMVLRRRSDSLRRSVQAQLNFIPRRRYYP